MSKHAERRPPPSRPRSRGPGGVVTAATPVQYTVRNVPAHVDRALRRKAREERKSLNQVLRDALIREAGAIEPGPRVYQDLDALAGRWVEDVAFDHAIRAQDQIDEALWR